MPDAIPRVTVTDDGVHVVVKQWMSFADYRSQNVFTREFPDFYTDPDGKDTLRIGTAMHPDESRDDVSAFEIHGVNTVYAEVPLHERELTDAEIEWCEETMTYSGSGQPETVIEFELPHPDELREALLAGDVEAYPEITTWNPDADSRHAIVTQLQKRIESERLRKRKLNWMSGYPVDLDPEWDPRNSHNDDRGKDALNDMAGMRSDAHLLDFQEITGVNYYSFLVARVRHLGIHEPWLEDTNLLGLGVADASHLSYCRLCGGVLFEEDFLHVERRIQDSDATIRVCEDCADSDHTNRFTEAAIAAAKDARAQDRGGQRRLEGDYADAEPEGQRETDSETEAD